MSDTFEIADQSFTSRLFLGTAGYPNQQVMLDAHAASGTELVTVSIRRISLEGYAESMVDLLGGRTRLLPNTAGCATVRDALLTAQLAREALETDWIKLELIGDRETLYPDVAQLLEAQGVNPAAPGLAVALNGAVVPRRAWGATALSPGDEVEIVKLFAGG